MATTSTEMASVRYLVDDVDRAIDFYTLTSDSLWASTPRQPSPKSLAERCGYCCPDPPAPVHVRCQTGATPVPGGWNRIHLIVDDITAEVARLRAAGLTFRNDIVKGPGGQQILLLDPAGNPVELFQPTSR